MNILDTIAGFITQFGQLLFGWLFKSDDPRIKQIQDKVIASCGFLPTAASVAAMLAATNPTVTGVVAIAQAICQVATASRYPKLASVNSGTVNGVPVEGDWIVKEMKDG